MTHRTRTCTSPTHHSVTLLLFIRHEQKCNYSLSLICHPKRSLSLCVPLSLSSCISCSYALHIYLNDFPTRDNALQRPLQLTDKSSGASRPFRLFFFGTSEHWSSFPFFDTDQSPIIRSDVHSSLLLSSLRSIRSTRSQPFLNPILLPFFATPFVPFVRFASGAFNGGEDDDDADDEEEDDVVVGGVSLLVVVYKQTEKSRFLKENSTSTQ